MSKAAGVAEIDDFLEAEIGRNIHELKRDDRALPQQDNATGEKLADDLGILFRRMTERATLEIEDLIDELHSLRTKLESDGDLIERAIERHSQFSQGTMQLTTMIADNVKRLPQPTS
jgi:hypothetical protein